MLNSIALIHIHKFLHRIKVTALDISRQQNSLYSKQHHIYILTLLGACDSSLESLQTEEQLLKNSKQNSKHSMRKPRGSARLYTMERKSGQGKEERRVKKATSAHLRPHDIPPHFVLTHFSPMSLHQKFANLF